LEVWNWLGWISDSGLGIEKTFLREFSK